MNTSTCKTPYCLHCYAALPSFEGPSQHCPVCDRINLRVDQRRLWTLESRVVAWEESLKIGVALLCGSMAAYVLFNPGFGVGRGHGMAFGAPILMAILLWDLVSITRRRSLFRGEILWPVLGGIVALFAVSGIVASIQSSGHANDLVPFLSLAVFTLPLLLAPLWTRVWKRWRERRVENGQLAQAA